MTSSSLDIAIIGAGFGGIGLAVQLKRSGFDNFTIFERATDVGGVWRDNTYPGAACDVPSRMYSFSFEQGFPWSERFGQQPEILTYLKHCAEKFGILPQIRFDTEIRDAAFDAETNKWRVSTAGGEDVMADLLVSAVGLFNQQTAGGVDSLAGAGDNPGGSLDRNLLARAIRRLVPAVDKVGQRFSPAVDRRSDVLQDVDETGVDVDGLSQLVGKRCGLCLEGINDLVVDIDSNTDDDRVRGTG